MCITQKQKVTLNSIKSVRIQKYYVYSSMGFSIVCTFFLEKLAAICRKTVHVIGFEKCEKEWQQVKKRFDNY